LIWLSLVRTCVSKRSGVLKVPWVSSCFANIIFRDPLYCSYKTARIWALPVLAATRCGVVDR